MESQSLVKRYLANMGKRRDPLSGDLSHHDSPTNSRPYSLHASASVSPAGGPFKKRDSSSVSQTSPIKGPACAAVRRERGRSDLSLVSAAQLPKTGAKSCRPQIFCLYTGESWSGHSSFAIRSFGGSMRRRQEQHNCTWTNQDRRSTSTQRNSQPEASRLRCTAIDFQENSLSDASLFRSAPE